MSKESQSFMDSKTIMAIVLVGLCWIGWQSYMQQKYPDLYKKKQAEQQQEVAVNGEAPSQKDSQSNNQEVSVGNNVTSKKAILKTPEPESRPEVFSEFENDKWSFKVSSKGMGLRDIRLKKYTERDGSNIKFAYKTKTNPFSTRLLNSRKPLDFEVRQESENHFVGVAREGQLLVEKNIRIKSNTYSIETEIVVSNIDERFNGLTIDMAKELIPTDGGSFLLPSFEKQEIFVYTGGSEERTVLMSDAEEQENVAYSKVSIAALSSQYFTEAFVDQSDVMPETKMNYDPKTSIASGTINYVMLNQNDKFRVKYASVIGPKDYTLLKKVDENLVAAIDYGMFSWMGRFMLRLMKWFHSLVGNWGIAIIILTIIVRIIVLPFHMMSYKSMKAMQVVQPHIKALREKYKDDQQKLNQEMMQLMKTHKVNPLGGCLPMLLQFPVFIALYQVLGQSIELYQAPFMFWITDLSLKDPFYVLPVLMGLTMFFQQKITPNTMDPAQQKIFMFMPIIFTLFMVSLPSGLTLYIFISALFGVVQQIYFMKDRTTEKKSIPVEATAK